MRTSAIRESDSWFVPLLHSDHAEITLLCFHHAGGRASMFQRWSSRLPESVNLWAAELPGHGRRFRETALVRLEPVMNGLRHSLQRLATSRVALFGHSMGALLAFECALALEEGGQDVPLLVVAGAPAPQCPNPCRHSRLSREQMLAHLGLLGGSPAEALENDDLIDLMLPIIRSDFAVLEDPSRQSNKTVKSALLALGGTDDPSVPIEALDGWRARTRGPYHRELLRGGHFFTQQSEDAMLELLAYAVRRHCLDNR